LAKTLPHAGGSALLDPLGAPVFEGGAEAAVLLGDADPGTVAQVRESYPFLADRRAPSPAGAAAR
jgi:predicted amidohydrolase